MKMTQEEEQIINSKLQAVLEQMQIDEAEFQKNAIYHSQDYNKQMEMMKIQKNAQSATGGEVLSREKTIETFKIQQDIQMKQMEIMMKDPSLQPNMMNQMTNEGQMQMMMKALVEQCRAQDQLFEQTGVEED